MLKLQEQRQRAVELYLEYADLSAPTLIDYYLDNFLRERFGLPDLPKGQPPYAGWMTGKNQSISWLKTSAKGVAIIKRWEGLRLNAYRCPAGVWTIGYGHTKGVKPGDRITRRQAEKYFLEELPVYEEAVKRNVKAELNQNQFDALVSFVYNVGERQFKNSTLLRLLNQSKYFEAAKQFKRWIYAGSKPLPGLIKRRREEFELFNL